MTESRTNSWDSLTPGKALLVTIVVPSLYLVALAVAWWSPKNFGFGIHWLAGTGLGIGLFGLSLWVVSMVQLGRSLAVLPGTEKLITTGIYKFLRHPIYVGIDLTLAGLFLALGSTYGFLYLGLVVLPLNIVRSRLEEKALLQKFGEPYRDYLSRTWF
jgi:protein-S-isoprenylcysteine O-methyltransferase